MRILHVLAERGFSGGENQLLATLRFLQSQGHEQIVIVDPRAEFAASVRDLGLRCEIVRYRNNYDLLAAWRLRRLYRELAPDLIHLTCSRSHKIGAMAAVFGSRLPPRVVTRRMDYPIGKTPFRRWIYGRAVQAVVAISTGVRDAVLRVGVDPDRIHLIHEGVDTKALRDARIPSRRSEVRAELGLQETDFFGVTTASLHRRKAHDILLESLAKVVVPDGRRIVWLFGGEGPERDALQARARGLPSSIEVRIPGQIDYVRDALVAADAYCLPSRYEGLGVALLEALATGVPCIATHVGGMRDVLVSGESGIHVAVESVDELAAAIQSLVDDTELRNRLGAAGALRAKAHFDVELMGQKTEALYERLATKASSASHSRASRGS